MSLRREKNADLEKIFYDFMNYYKYKNLYEYDYNYHHNHNGGGNNHHNGGGDNHHNGGGNNHHNGGGDNHHNGGGNNHHNGGGNNHQNGGGNNHQNGGGNNHHNGGGNNHHNGGENNHHNGSGSNNKPMPIPFYFLPPYRTDEYADEYTSDSRASKVMMPAKVCNVNETFPTVYTPNTNNIQGRVDNNTQTDAMYYKALFANLNKNLMPYVENIVKQNSYVGSPINDKYFDKETLAQLVSDVLEKAKDNPELVAYIVDLDPKVKELMKNIVEALLLGELFLVYRPNNKLNTGNMTSKDSMNNIDNMNPVGDMGNMLDMTKDTSMGSGNTGRYNNMYGDPKNSKPLDENMDMYLNDCPQPYISEEIIKPKTVVNPYRSDDMQYYSN